MKLLLIILLVSIFCNGMKILFDEGMLLHWFKVWIQLKIKGPKPNINDLHYFSGLIESWEKRGEWILKPIVGCVYCFASFWGSIAYWVLTIFVFQLGVNVPTLTAWPIVCICCIWLNGLLYGLISKYEEWQK